MACVTEPRRFLEITELRQDVGIQLLDFEYVLIDLSRYPDQFLKERLELELALSLLRHVRDQKSIAYLQRILPLLLQLRFRKTDLDCIETMLRYIYYLRGKAEWNDPIEIMHRSDPIIEGGSPDDDCRAFGGKRDVL
jgi:hypothetical protein